MQTRPKFQKRNVEEKVAESRAKMAKWKREGRKREGKNTQGVKYLKVGDWQGGKEERRKGA